MFDPTVQLPNNSLDPSFIASLPSFNGSLGLTNSITPDTLQRSMLGGISFMPIALVNVQNLPIFAVQPQPIMLLGIPILPINYDNLTESNTAIAGQTDDSLTGYEDDSFDFSDTSVVDPLTGEVSSDETDNSFDFSDTSVVDPLTDPALTDNTDGSFDFSDTSIVDPLTDSALTDSTNNSFDLFNTSSVEPITNLTLTDNVDSNLPFALASVSGNSNLNLRATSANIGTDFDGDGKTDFIRQEKNGWDNDNNNTANVYLSRGNGTFSKQDLTDWQYMKGDFTNLIFGDYNGDGNTDFIRQEKGAWDNDNNNTANVYLSRGNGTFSKQDLTDWQYMKGDFTNLIAGDYNGDGNTDFIRQEKGVWDNDNNNTANVYLSNGDGTFRKQMLTNWQYMKGDFTNLIAGDYNGDGNTDFIRQEKGTWDNDSIDTANVYLSNGDGTFRKQMLTDWQYMKGDFTNLITGDYNGDGNTDFIRQEKGTWDNDSIDTANVYFSNGDGTFRKQTLTDWQQMKGDQVKLITGDYNGDGRTDFIRQEKNDWDNGEVNTANVYLANADGTFTGKLLTNFQQMKGDLTDLITGDYNGDGKTDFIRQERGRWDDDDNLTAEIYLSNGDGTFSNQLLTDWQKMKGDAGVNILTSNTAPISKFQDPVNTSQQWQATIFNWDRSHGNQPVTNFWNTDSSDGNTIGVINLGSNTRKDGKKGISADWGTGAPNGDNRLPVDDFAIRAYTQASFDGSEYKFRVKADDGFQLMAKNRSTGKLFNITPVDSWQQSYGYKEIKYKLPAGNYDMYFNQYEAAGNAYLDLSWEKGTSTNSTNYFPGLRSLTSDEWDHQTGDNDLFDGNPKNGESRSEVKQIYRDLSTAILGSPRSMNAGYLYDTSYHAGVVINKTTGWWHSGIDIKASIGDSVKAAVGGRIVWTSSTRASENGYFIAVEDKAGRRWVYGHLQSLGNWKIGDPVKVGDKIGQVGAQLGSNAHFHLAVGTKNGNVSSSQNQAQVRNATMSPLEAYWRSKNG